MKSTVESLLLVSYPDGVGSFHAFYLKDMREVQKAIVQEESVPSMESM